MALIDAFQAVVRANPAAPMCIYQHTVYSRAQMLRLVRLICQSLLDQGLKRGDVVGVGLDYSPVLPAAVMALARLGVLQIAMPGPALIASHKYLIEQFGVTHHLGQTAVSWGSLKALVLPDTTELLTQSLALHTQEGHKDFDVADLSVCDFWPDDNTPGRIGLSSGTSGHPSGILYHHGYWFKRITSSLHQCDDSSRLMPGNMHLSIGHLSSMACLLGGGTLVLAPQEGPKSYFESIRLYGVTHTASPPSMMSVYAAMNTEPGLAWPSLKSLSSVGGAITLEQIEQVRTRLTPNLYMPYGLTELGAVTMANPASFQTHPHTCGLIRPGIDAQVVDADDQPLAPGESGELRIKVPGMAQSYYLNPQRSAQKFKNGWFYTGDIGNLDKDGYLTIEGRLDDKINIGGLKLFPEQVESVLLRHPEVREAAVFVGLDDQGNKQLTAAVVLTHSGVPRLKLLEFCRRAKLGARAPKRFHVVQALPRNPTGKLLRRDLADWVKPKAKPEAAIAPSTIH